MKTQLVKPSGLKGALWNWLGIPGIPADAGDGTAYVVPDFAGRQELSFGGFYGSDRAVMSLSAAWRCVKLISETIATLPFEMFEIDGRRLVPSTTHELSDLLRWQPNDYTTAVEFWESIVASLLLHGEAYAQKNMLGTRVVSLDFVPFYAMSKRMLPNGDYQFSFTDRFGKSHVVAEDDMFYLRGFSLNGRDGISVISWGALSFSNSLAADTAARKTFQNGLLATVYYKMSAYLKPEQRKEFRENIKEITGALNAGKSPLLEGGMDIGTTGINPNDAQLLETRSYNVEDVCRWFGVPPALIGHGDKQSSWPTSVEAQGRLFLRDTLRPWLTRIEQSVRKELLRVEDRKKYIGVFDANELMRGDSQARGMYISQMTQNGVITRNEARDIEKFERTNDPMADELTVQSNLIPLSKLGQNVPTATPQAPNPTDTAPASRSKESIR